MVDPSALERSFTIPERNRAIVREFREVMERGYMAKNGVRRAPLIGKTIVFAVTKRHAETLAQMFDAEFADKKADPATKYADYVVSDMGNDSTVDAFTKIKRFKDEEFPKILVSVNMLDTGFDCPEVVNLVMARFEYMLDDGLRIDYVLADRRGKSLAVVEAKRESVNPADAANQALEYAKRLQVPFIFLTNGDEIRFWDHEREAHPRPVATFFSQTDLERRTAARVGPKQSENMVAHAASVVERCLYFRVLFRSMR